MIKSNKISITSSWTQLLAIFFNSNSNRPSLQFCFLCIYFSSSLRYLKHKRDSTISSLTLVEVSFSMSGNALLLLMHECTVLNIIVQCYAYKFYQQMYLSKSNYLIKINNELSYTSIPESSFHQLPQFSSKVYVILYRDRSIDYFAIG